MPDQYVADLQRDWLHSNFSGFHGSKRFFPRHTVCAGRNFDRAVLRRYPDQAKAHDQHIGGQQEVGSFAEQRTPIVNMNALVIRAAQRRITAPLIGDYPVLHHATHDAQHVVVKEKVWNKARGLKGHREKVAMLAAVRLVAVGLEISEENRPKRASANRTLSAVLAATMVDITTAGSAASSCRAACSRKRR